MKKGLIIFSIVSIITLQKVWACTPPPGYAYNSNEVILIRLNNQQDFPDCSSKTLPIKDWSLTFKGVEHKFSIIDFPFSFTVPFIVIFYYFKQTLLLFLSFLIRYFLFVVLAIVFSCFYYFYRKKKGSIKANY